MSRSERRAVASLSSDHEVGSGQDGSEDGSEDPQAFVRLVEDAQTGSREELRRFLEAIAPVARQTCRGVLGGAHPDLEDVMQECLMACVKALPKFRFEGDVRAYVTTIALRIAIPARRRTAAMWRSHAPVDGNEPAELANWAPPTEFASVRRMFESLTVPQREALYMRVVLGCSIQEIAAKVGVSPTTIKTRLRHAKNMLRHRRGPLGLWKRLFQEKLG